MSNGKVKRSAAEWREIIDRCERSGLSRQAFCTKNKIAKAGFDKFRYHLPLYRQHQRMKAAGVDVSRASLTNWTLRAIALLEPIYLAQRASVLASDVLAMDETPIRAGRKAKGKMKTACFRPMYGDRDKVVFPYADSRAHRNVEAFLGDFEGTLLADGYGAYPARVHQG